MQEASAEYRAAITGGGRKIAPLAVIDLVDPDIVYGAVLSNGIVTYSDPGQIYNKKLSAEGPRYGTLERNRFVLDGKTTLLPDDPKDMKGEHGYLIGIMSKDDCTFDTNPFVELNMTNLSIMQAASIHFTGSDYDGYGVDFLFEIYSGSTVVLSKNVIGNAEQAVYFEGFTLLNITKIRAIFTKWSIPRRYVRVSELVPGIYEKWDGRTIYTIDVMQETAFDCMTVPYGSCSLEAVNQQKRFNPFNKGGLFRSLEARQGIPVSYGVELEDGQIEHLPLGVYYQQNGGWETDAYGLTIKFRLVDIVGMIANRSFNIPAILPTTLSGWIAAIVAHLGDNFADRHLVDSAVASFSVTTTAERLKSTNCGQILRYACMAAGAFFRADAGTGKLRVEPLKNITGTLINLDNMHSYPQNKAGDDIAQITFRLADEANTEHKVDGTTASSDKSLSISNPFIHTVAQADTVAANIMKFYGVTRYTIKGRGDFCCELGDTDSFETGFGGTANGIRYKQQFRIEGGVMKTAPSYFIGFEEVTEQ